MPKRIGDLLVRRYRTQSRILLLVGLLLAAGGLAGFGIAGDHNRHLLRTGRHTSATVISVVPYSGALIGPDAFNEHVDVQFADSTGRSTVARLGIGENDRYSVGQRVQIVYDPANPSRALFAHGSTDTIGFVGFILLLAMIFGSACS
jgi:hypothetical protein